MKKEDIIHTKKTVDELNALKKRSVDLTDPDAPEITEWDELARGKFYRPCKQQLTLRLDKDVLSWFKSQPGKYQTLINQVCRDYMNKHKKRKK
ncbi:BrnA antitoxin family protein [Candidiatus Paracoxiella cheracis]|uniref:BrnA antitoxin family protein n=1 Tax=Candidiatus Paracoxiella cheracis TaxID=3405120 RepID=UPI003BF5C093